MRDRKRYAIALVVLLLLAAAPTLADNSVPADALQVRQSVYRILCEDDEYVYSGSSFVLGSDQYGTYVATNFHVVEEAKEGSMRLVRHDGREIPVTIEAYDEDYDLCVLKTATVLPDAKPLTLYQGDDDLVGSAVYAFGFPGAGDYLLNEMAYRVQDITLTNGIVSAVKQVRIGIKQVTMIQMNAAINSGSSGGPLVDAAGTVIGVNTLEIVDASSMFAAVSTRHLVSLLKSNAIPYAGTRGSHAPSVQVAALKQLPEQPFLQQFFLYVGAAGLAVVALYALRCLLGKHKRTLQELMKEHPGGFAPEAALAMLAPVLAQLRELHAVGGAYGAVAPGNILVDAQLRLHLRQTPQDIVWDSEALAYKAPEMLTVSPAYDATSDVYAVGAVLQLLVTGTPPPDARTRERMQLPAAQPDGLPQGLQSALARATMLKKLQRYPNSVAFMHDIGFTEEWLHAPGNKRLLTKNQTQRILIATVAVVLVAGGGYLCNGILTQNRYRSAMVYAQNQDFTQASKEIKSVYQEYEDAAQLFAYIQAGAYLEQESYLQAKEAFVALGDYMDSAALARLSEYRQALYLVEQNVFEDAQDLFAALGDYEDSAAWVTECDYLRAQYILKQEHFEEAAALFAQLGSYKDSEEMIRKTHYDYANYLLSYGYQYEGEIDQYWIDWVMLEEGEEIDEADIPREAYYFHYMSAALDELREAGNYGDAEGLLIRTQERIYYNALKYLEDFASLYEAESEFYNAYGDADKLVGREMARLHFLLIPKYRDVEALTVLLNVLYLEDLGEQYKQLKSMEHLELAQKLVRTEVFIYQFLEGSWKGDGRYFRVRNKNGNMTLTDNLPNMDGDYWKIEDGQLWTSDTAGIWTSRYEFQVIDDDTIEFRWKFYIYRMTRQ